MRIKHKREYYIPKDATERQDPESSAVVHTYENINGCYALAFHGRAQKPDWHYRFRSLDDREKRIINHFEKIRAWEDHAKRRRAERNAAPRGLEIGDILHASWGYDQTNNDYYQVVDLKGEKQVVLRTISQGYRETGWLRGQAWPIKDSFTSEETFTRVARDGWVTIDRVRSASKCAPDAVHHDSSYA